MKTLSLPARDGQALDREFVRGFRAFEASQLEYRERLASLAGLPDLDERLSAEVLRQDSTILPDLGWLGDRALEWSADQAQAHLALVLGSRLSSILREGSFFRQILGRPRGYPGDAEMMRFIYRAGLEGETPFGRFWHRRAVCAPTAAAVRNRKDLLMQRILQRPGAAVLSLAAGPCEELRAVLRQSTADYSVLALDHDPLTLRELGDLRDGRFQAALANAFRMMKGDDRIATPRLRGALCGKPSRDFRGWRRYLVPFRYRVERLRGRRFDLVYSAGLFDYLRPGPDGREASAQALTCFLFELVAPGGELLIGNFNPSIPAWNRFCMDYLCNWPLVYRTDAELRSFAAGIDPRQLEGLEVVKEAEGINSFLVLRKRAEAAVSRKGRTVSGS